MQTITAKTAKKIQHIFRQKTWSDTNVINQIGDDALHFVVVNVNFLQQMEIYSRNLQWNTSCQAWNK